MKTAGEGLLDRPGATLLFLVLLLLRVSVAAQFIGNYDSESFLIVADAVLHGQNVYQATDRYNYGPAWASVVASLWLVARPSVDLFLFLIGLFLIAADGASSWVLLRLARDRLGMPPPMARRTALLFFSNPVSVLVSGAHGQFDGLSILFLLAAVLVATGGGLKEKQWTVAGLLGASLVVKHVTLFQPLLFWKKVRRPGLSDAAVGLPYALFVASLLPFAAAWRGIVRNVFLYSSGGDPDRLRPGGLQSYVTLPGAPRMLYGTVLVVAVVWVISKTRTDELPRACFLLSLVTLVFLPGLSDQYLVWPVALGALYPTALFGLFSAAGGLWYARASLHLPLPVWTDRQAAWVAALLWLVIEAGRLARDRASDLRPAGEP